MATKHEKRADTVHSIFYSLAAHMIDYVHKTETHESTYNQQYSDAMRVVCSQAMEGLIDGFTVAYHEKFMQEEEQRQANREAKP